MCNMPNCVSKAFLLTRLKLATKAVMQRKTTIQLFHVVIGGQKMNHLSIMNRPPFHVVHSNRIKRRRWLPKCCRVFVGGADWNGTIYRNWNWYYPRSSHSNSLFQTAPHLHSLITWCWCPLMIMKMSGKDTFHFASPFQWTFCPLAHSKCDDI